MKSQIKTRTGSLSFLPQRKPRFRFPGPSDRVTINGMTGSGKSVFGMWLMSESADFDKKPWIILDYKGETLIQQAVSEGIFEDMRVDAKLPKNNGVHVVRHNARDGQTLVTDLLWRIYEAGNIGLFLDEATMVPELRGEANSGGPFQSIISQGRSKTIPLYVLAQRPVNVNKMVYSENNYYSAFRVRSRDDLKKITDHIPENSDGFQKVWARDVKLQPFYSRWYDAQQDISWILHPCPPPEKILDQFSFRIDRMRKTEKI
jgi:hypothetical protein